MLMKPFEMSLLASALSSHQQSYKAGEKLKRSDKKSELDLSASTGPGGADLFSNTAIERGEASLLIIVPDDATGLGASFYRAQTIRLRMVAGWPLLFATLQGHQDIVVAEKVTGSDKDDQQSLKKRIVRDPLTYSKLFLNAFVQLL